MVGGGIIIIGRVPGGARAPVFGCSAPAEGVGDARAGGAPAGVAAGAGSKGPGGKPGGSGAEAPGTAPFAIVGCSGGFARTTDASGAAADVTAGAVALCMEEAGTIITGP